MDYQAAQKYRAMIEQLRDVVVRTPMWRPTIHNGQPVVIATHTNDLLLRIESDWASDLQRFFDVFHQYNLIKLVALLERMPGPPREKAAELLEAFLTPLPTASPWTDATADRR